MGSEREEGAAAVEVADQQDHDEHAGEADAKRRADQDAASAQLRREQAVDGTLAPGVRQRGRFSTGGFLGGLAGGNSLQGVYTFTPAQAGRHLVSFHADYAGDFGVRLVVRDAETQTPVASYATGGQTVDVGFVADADRRYEIVVEPLRTSAYLRNPDARKASEDRKWFYIGDRVAGGDYSLVVRAVTKG